MKDKILENLIHKEIIRQRTSIDLIASENYPSEDIMKVVGSPLMTKYSEGYPGKRYYPGNGIYDEIEKLAISRAKKVFKLNDDWHVNVQPYSGSPANMAIYGALMEKGETLMGMSLSSGGHLTHGHHVSFSGKNYKSVQYGVNEETGLIDYDAVLELAEREDPKVIVSGFTAYPRKIDFEKFGLIARKVGAFHVADISHIAGLVAGGAHPSPFNHADVVMTTTHKTLRGPRGAVIFCRKELGDRIDRAVFPGLQGGPHDNIIAAKALMFFEAAQSGFKIYQKQIIKNAAALSEALEKSGFKLVTGGTDNHLLLVDLKTADIDGLSAEKKLEEAGITANRNSIPGDTSPFRPSGIRLGTPAVTTRGMKEREMKLIAELIRRVIIKKEEPRAVRKDVEMICKKFPLPYKYK